jgi:hypothetical protein
MRYLGFELGFTFSHQDGLQQRAVLHAGYADPAAAAPVTLSCRSTS